MAKKKDVPVIDQSAKSSVDKPTLERIVTLAKQQVAIEKELLVMIDSVKKKQKDLEKIKGGYGTEGSLVSAMKEADCKELQLGNGVWVRIKDELKPPSMAVDAPNRGIVLEWAETEGHGDIIKDKVEIPFPKGDERVPGIIKILEEQQIEFGRFRTIAPQTLAALIRELMEAGKDVPMQKLGVQEFSFAKVEAD